MSIYKAAREFGVTWKRVIVFGMVSLGAALFEGFGLAMFLPVLEFIEKDQNVTVMEGAGRAWDVLGWLSTRTGISLGLEGLLALLVLLMLLRVVMIYVRKAYVSWLTQHVLFVTQTKLFSAFMHAEYELFDRVSTGKLINLMTTEAQRVSGYINGIFQCCALSLLVAGYVTVLLWLSLPMTIVALGLLVLSGSLVGLFVNRNTREVSNRTTSANREFSFFLVEMLTSVRLVKVSAAVSREVERVANVSRQVRANYYKLKMLNARVELIFEPILTVAGALILYLSFSVFSMSLAQIGVFMLVLIRLMPVSKELLMARQNVLSCTGSLAAVESAYSEAKAKKEAFVANGICFSKLCSGIDLRGVRFIYPGKEAPALNGLDLFIPSGKVTAIVGPSGSGKSTLVDCLVGLRKPQEGRILLDEIPLMEYDLNSVRKAVAFVSQDITLLNDTVKANLLFTRPDATDAEVRSAMDKAQVSEFVDPMPDGWNTVLGERGIRISGGQKQRLSLARALLQNAPILILDEATSALDSEKELDIQAVIQNMQHSGEATIVVIAHRFSTIRNADRIIVLSEGRVVEEGTHDQLMLSEDWYGRVSGMQLGSELSGIKS